MDTNYSKGVGGNVAKSAIAPFSRIESYIDRLANVYSRILSAKSRTRHTRDLLHGSPGESSDGGLMKEDLRPSSLDYAISQVERELDTLVSILEDVN